MPSAGLQHLITMVNNYVNAYKQAKRNGDKEEAYTSISRAVEILDQIIRLYGDLPIIKVYVEMRNKYARIKKSLENEMLLATAETSGGEADETYRVELRKNPPLVPKPEAIDSDELPDFVEVGAPANITFDDIAGLEEAKEAIMESIVYPIKEPDLFPLGWPRGILLYGPPGTGKTMLAAAVANMVDGEFLYVDAAGIMSKWLGEGEKNVKKLFSYARAKAKKGTPVIIFIDEIDALLGVHDSEVGGEVRVRNQFLKEMDGLQDKGSKIHVYVIGATNKPWKLDEPFIRRFQKRIYVPLPDYEARLQLLKMLTSKIQLAPDVDLEELARRLEGYSASDIKDIVTDAHLITIREYFKTGKGPRPVSMKDFERVLERRKPSVDKRMLSLYEKWAREHGAF
ncbi:MAG: ATP-binding protein [Desulfurococcales archaeon]|nr:ATP-binding protein [Desulfurococcales archaeon]